MSAADEGLALRGAMDAFHSYLRADLPLLHRALRCTVLRQFPFPQRTEWGEGFATENKPGRATMSLRIENNNGVLVEHLIL